MMRPSAPLPSSASKRTASLLRKLPVVFVDSEELVDEERREEKGGGLRYEELFPKAKVKETSIREAISSLEDKITHLLEAKAKKYCDHKDKDRRAKEQIIVLDASMVELHSLLRAEIAEAAGLIGRLWRASSDLHTDLLSSLSSALNALQFELADAKEEEKKAKSELSKYVNSASEISSSTSEMKNGDFARMQRLEEELRLRANEMRELKDSIVSITMWFPNFEKYKASILRRHLPLLQTEAMGEAPAVSTTKQRQTIQPKGTTAIDDSALLLSATKPPMTERNKSLAQDFLFRDLCRLEDLGIGLSIVTPTSSSLSSNNSNSNSNSSSKRGNGQQQQGGSNADNSKRVQQLLLEGQTLEARVAQLEEEKQEALAKIVSERERMQEKLRALREATGSAYDEAIALKALALASFTPLIPHACALPVALAPGHEEEAKEPPLGRNEVFDKIIHFFTYLCTGGHSDTIPLSSRTSFEECYMMYLRIVKGQTEAAAVRGLILMRQSMSFHASMIVRIQQRQNNRSAGIEEEDEEEEEEEGEVEQDEEGPCTDAFLLAVASLLSQLDDDTAFSEAPSSSFEQLNGGLRLRSVLAIFIECFKASRSYIVAHQNVPVQRARLVLSRVFPPSPFLGGGTAALRILWWHSLPARLFETTLRGIQLMSFNDAPTTTTEAAAAGIDVLASHVVDPFHIFALSFSAVTKLNGAYTTLLKSFFAFFESLFGFSLYGNADAFRDTGLAWFLVSSFLQSSFSTYPLARATEEAAVMPISTYLHHELHSLASSSRLDEHSFTNAVLRSSDNISHIGIDDLLCFDLDAHPADAPFLQQEEGRRALIALQQAIDAAFGGDVDEEDEAGEASVFRTHVKLCSVLKEQERALDDKRACSRVLIYARLAFDDALLAVRAPSYELFRFSLLAAQSTIKWLNTKDPRVSHYEARLLSKCFYAWARSHE